MKKVLCFLMLVAAIAPITAGGADIYTISVSQFVEHPALDSVLQGFQDYLKAEAIKVKYNVHNAQANMATANQIGSQILGEKPDLILSITTPSSQACAQALKKAPHMRDTPLLFTAVTDPIAAGLVKDLKRPGGNITGVADRLPFEQHMQMVKDFLPEIKKLGVMYNSGETNSRSSVAYIKKVAPQLGFEVIEATVSKTSEVYQAAKSLAGRVDAVFVPTDNTVVQALESAIKACLQSQLPLFCADVDSVERGAIAAMGFDYYQHGRQTGAMAIRILKGARPADIPVEFQKELALHINTKYAPQMGIVIPPGMLAKAAKVH